MGANLGGAVCIRSTTGYSASTRRAQRPVRHVSALPAEYDKHASVEAYLIRAKNARLRANVNLARN